MRRRRQIGLLLLLLKLSELFLTELRELLNLLVLLDSFLLALHLILMNSFLTHLLTLTLRLLSLLQISLL